MKYDRLKENIEILYMHNELHTPVMKLTDYKKPETDLIREIVSDCREILNKIEQGTLIELPCKVGDTLYWVSSNNRDIIEAVVTKITLVQDRIVIFVYEEGIGEYSFCAVFDIYLTREEAEKRLLELQGDKE